VEEETVSGIPSASEVAAEDCGAVLCDFFELSARAGAESIAVIAKAAIMIDNVVLGFFCIETSSCEVSISTLADSAKHMPGDIDERCFVFQLVMQAASMMGRRLMVEIGEKLADWRADLLITTEPLLLFPPVISDARKFLNMGGWRSFLRVLLIILHVEYRQPVLPRAFIQDIR